MVLDAAGFSRVLPGPRTETTAPEPAGCPTHTGRLPALADPAVGPAGIRGNFPAGAPSRAAAKAAVPDPAAGHATWRAREGGIGGIFTVWPGTRCTATGFPADEPGGLPHPPNTPTAVSTPATSDAAASTDTITLACRRRRPRTRLRPEPLAAIGSLRNAR